MVLVEVIIGSGDILVLYLQYSTGSEYLIQAKKIHNTNIILVIFL